MPLEFDEQSNLSRTNILYSNQNKDDNPRGIIVFLIRHKVFKNEKVARAVILILAILIFAISIYLIFNSFNGPVFIS